MKTLIICEKAEAGRHLAENINNPNSKNGKGFIEGDNYIITWAMGHLYILEIPERVKKDYKLFNKLKNLEEYKQKDLINVPFVLDDDEKRYPYDKNKRDFCKVKYSQYKIIESFLKRKDINNIILAADADAEGERIHGDIIKQNYNKIPHLKSIKIDRFWNPGSYKAKAAVEKALKERKPFSDNKFQNLYDSAASRSITDYLIGMKLTKVMSERYNKFMTAGRVQSAVIGMIGRRMDEIKNFKPKPFWNLKGSFKGLELLHYYYATDVDDNGKSKKVKTSNYFIESELNNTVDDINNVKLKGIVKILDVKKGLSSSKPKLFDTGGFETEFMSKYKTSLEMADLVLEYLREEGFTTYPRTDGVYFSQTDFQEVEEALQTSLNYFSGVSIIKEVKKLTDKNSIFNNKLAASQNHTPLSLTTKIPSNNDINKWKNVKFKGKNLVNVKEGYEMIAKRLLVQVLPDDEFEKVHLVLDINNHLFELSGDKPIKQGWRELTGNLKRDTSFPISVKKGDEITLEKLIKNESLTTKPPQYTEVSLAKSMINITKALEEEIASIDDNIIRKQKEKEFNKIKTILLNVKGIGTQATRKTILLNLKNRNFISFKNKKVDLTETGYFMYNKLPAYVMSLETSAIWEEQLDLIRQGKIKSNDFIKDVDKQIMNNIIPDLFNQSELDKKNNTGIVSSKPSDKQISFANKLANDNNVVLTDDIKNDKNKISDFINTYFKPTNSDGSIKKIEYTISDKQRKIIIDPRNKASKVILKLLEKDKFTKTEFDKIKKWLDNFFKKLNNKK